MRSPENENDFQESDQGYSEKALDLDAEIAAGEWETLKKFKTYQKRSRQGKIIATYQAVSNRLNQLVGMYYKFVGVNPKEAAKLLEELRRLRLIQEILLNCLVWSSGARSGSVQEQNMEAIIKNEIPEVWELIK